MDIITVYIHNVIMSQPLRLSCSTTVTRFSQLASVSKSNNAVKVFLTEISFI